MTKSEVNIRCFASGDHSWGTADIYSAALQKGINISYTEKKSSSNLSSRAAALQNDPISPYGAEEGDKAFSRIQEADDKCEKHEEVLKSPKSVSGRLIFMESPPCTPRPKAVDKQASMKMSRQYYEIGSNSSRRKVPSRAPSRSSAVDIECGKEDKQRCGRKRKEKSGAVHISKSRTLATNEVDSAKESTESSTSLASNCSDEEDHEGHANDEGVDVGQCIRHMVLQKYVMMPGKRKKMQSREKQPEYVLCQGCPVVEQGLSTPALLPGPVEILDVKCCKPGTNDTSLSPAVRTPYTVDGADNRVTHRIAMLKQANNGGKAEESRYSHERSEAKHREGAQESRGGSNPVKKVSICITNYSLRCTLSDASM